MDLTWAPAPSASGGVATEANVFTEVTGTFTFNDEDVRSVYIDWGDGTTPAGAFTNDKDYANYQWYNTTEPTGQVAITHTYTATGTFDPVVQVLNSRGFFSGYQKRGTAPTTVSPSYISQGTVSGMAVYDGTATGVMRLENKTVKSGIDNSIFEKEGAKDIYFMVAPLCSTAELTTISSITIEIEALTESSLINNTDASVLGGAGTNVQTFSSTITSFASFGGLKALDPSDGSKISKILKVTYKNPKYVGASGATDYSSNAAYQNLKIFLVVTGKDGKFYPITYVSAGSPIKKADDPLRNVTLDFSQSRAKASNITLDSYRYDNGKVWFNPAYQWAITSNVFTDDTKQTSEIRKVAYTYENVRPDGLNGQATVNSTISLAFSDSGTAYWDRNNTTQDQLYRVDQFVVDEFGRFTDQYHLTRMSADPNTTDKDATSNVSSIIDNKPYVFRITPWGTDHRTGTSADPSAAGNNLATKLDISTVASGNYTADYTDEAFANGSGNMVSLSGMNTQTWKDIETNTRPYGGEYILLLFPEKTNKVCFNINNFANSLIDTNLADNSFTSGWDINGISYLVIEESGTKKQKAYWQPVEFNDTTKVSMEYRDTANNKYITQSNSLSQSGYVSFNMPLDWTSTDLPNLCGGQWDTAMTTATSGTFDIVVSGTYTDLGTGANAEYGGVGTLTALSGSEVTVGVLDEDTLGTADDIGAFRYLGFCQSTGNATGISINPEKVPVWICSGNGNGMNDARNTLYMTYGDFDGGYTDDSSAGGITTGDDDIRMLIRRVNIYDVITGVSKVSLGEAGTPTVTKLIPVDGSKTTSIAYDFPSKYFLSGAAGAHTTFGGGIDSAWSGTSLYALKIDLSGAATQTHAFPEIWNVFDGNRGYEDIVKEVDDTAYNLNALPLVSDIAVARGGAFYSAITRKGKVFIARTGDTLQNIGFSSIALGDTSVSDPFDDYGAPSTLYGQLRKIRALHANNVRVFWDEIQKDGTYTRYWGIITTVSETHGTGGPASVTSYNFSIMIEEIALLDTDGTLMTDVFPLGGIGDEKSFT